MEESLPPETSFFSSFFNGTYRIPFAEIKEKILEQSRFAPAYFLLMICSVIICTLGLLLDAPAVVIGGMIISPLMWPLMHVALGIATADKKMLLSALKILLISVGISLITALFITYISPIKIVTKEILSRSNPTIIDLIIALTSGIIATVALFHRRISESLAGVAIATSLMPPLCVSGIGFILGDMTVSGGSFLLFTTNVIAIIFIAVIIFTLLGFEKKEAELRKKAVYFLVFIMILISVPLVILYNNYAFRIATFSKTKTILSEYFQEVSDQISVEGINLSYSSGFIPSEITVYADVLIPSNMVLDYAQREEIVKRLEEKLNKKINIKLRILPTASFITFEKQKSGIIQKLLSDAFKGELTKLHPESKIDTFSLIQDTKSGSVIIDSTIFIDPAETITEDEQKQIEKSLTSTVHKPVKVNLVLLPRLNLVSGEDLTKTQIKTITTTFFLQRYPESQMKDMTIAKGDTVTYLDVEVYVPTGSRIEESDIAELKEKLVQEFEVPFTLNIHVLETQNIKL